MPRGFFRGSRTERRSALANGGGMEQAVTAASPVALVRALLARAGRGGAVLTRPSTVAWLTGGANTPIDRTAAVDVVWGVVTADRVTLLTTDVERPRLLAEVTGAATGFDVAAAPWWEPRLMVEAAWEIAGHPPDGLVTDGHPDLGLDVTDDLVRARLVLSADEQNELRALGRDTAEALQTALCAWTPGETDLDIQSGIVSTLERRGADSPVVIVGGDDRVRRFRHPVAVGAPIRELAMAVVVSRRRGLHVAATRTAAVRGTSDELVRLQQQARRIEVAVLAATAPRRTYGAVLGALDAAYDDVGFPGEWRKHYQGGPIGYQQREFEIAPVQDDSPWWNEQIRPGHAVAWNPSLTGGAKVEDTYLVTADGNVRVTDAPGWPTVETDAGPLPAILEVS